MTSWLAVVRHDLVKHALWRARDLQAAGSAVQAGDMHALRGSLLALPDDEGHPTTATRRWQALRQQAPPGHPAALDAFEAAVLNAEAAAAALPAESAAASAITPDAWSRALGAILALEPAFAALARSLNPP